MVDRHRLQLAAETLSPEDDHLEGDKFEKLAKLGRERARTLA